MSKDVKLEIGWNCIFQYPELTSRIMMIKDFIVELCCGGVLDRWEQALFSIVMRQTVVDKSNNLLYVLWAF